MHVTMLYEIKIVGEFNSGQAKHSQLLDVHAKCVTQ